MYTYNRPELPVGKPSDPPLGSGAPELGVEPRHQLVLVHLGRRNLLYNDMTKYVVLTIVHTYTKL